MATQETEEKVNSIFYLRIACGVFLPVPYLFNLSLTFYLILIHITNYAKRKKRKFSRFTTFYARAVISRKGCAKTMRGEINFNSSKLHDLK